MTTHALDFNAIFFIFAEKYSIEYKMPITSNQNTSFLVDPISWAVPIIRPWSSIRRHFYESEMGIFIEELVLC